MAIERDYNAERTARIDLLMSEAKRILQAPLDRTSRNSICSRLDATLKELGARAPMISRP
jgi:hypothetical protein